MRLILAVILAAFISTAHADDLGIVPSDQYGGVKFGTGAVLDNTAASPTTTDSVDFGFQAHHVRICMRPENSTTVYFRLGHTLTSSSQAATEDGTGMTIYTPSGNFIDDNEATTGAALPIYVANSTTASFDQHRCFNANWVTRGITMFVSTEAATADVWAFPRGQNPRN